MMFSRHLEDETAEASVPVPAAVQTSVRAALGAFLAEKGEAISPAQP